MIQSYNCQSCQHSLHWDNGNICFFFVGPSPWECRFTFSQLWHASLSGCITRCRRMISPTEPLFIFTLVFDFMVFIIFVAVGYSLVIIARLKRHNLLIQYHQPLRWYLFAHATWVDHAISKVSSERIFSLKKNLHLFW